MFLVDNVFLTSFMSMYYFRPRFFVDNVFSTLFWTRTFVDDVFINAFFSHKQNNIENHIYMNTSQQSRHSSWFIFIKKNFKKFNAGSCMIWYYRRPYVSVGLLFVVSTIYGFWFVYNICYPRIFPSVLCRFCRIRYRTYFFGNGFM
jgi:hypothetical protein